MLGVNSKNDVVRSTADLLHPVGLSGHPGTPGAVLNRTPRGGATEAQTRETVRAYPSWVDEEPVSDGSFELRPIGRVESSLVDPAGAPKQGDEGSPDAWLVFEDDVAEGLRDLRVGTEVVVLTWLHRGRRDVLAVHPRDDPSNPETGVFSTRSADRPNPIGLHRVEILAVAGVRIQVRHLEAIDGTPIVDVKPVLPRDQA